MTPTSFSEKIRGFAVLFDYYSELIEECVKECGFEYARISEESYSFTPQSDFYKWQATIFHCDNRLKVLTQAFIETEEELALFQVVGHSYNLDVENKWNNIEDVCKTISEQDDILPMTTIQIINYLKAINNVEITNEYIQNNSEISVWLAINDITYEVKAREKLILQN